MRGQRTKWILGTDHAGIATQTQVDRALAEQGLDREQLGRDEFVRRVWEWREEYGGTIIEQLKRRGSSCDYEDERFTLDEDYVRGGPARVRGALQQGFIYRDRYLVNWDPGTRSAISDLEVEEREGHRYALFIRYPLAPAAEAAVGGDDRVTVATVRPEDDASPTLPWPSTPTMIVYRDLVGRQAILPLVGRELPVIADEFVKPEFGPAR